MSDKKAKTTPQFDNVLMRMLKTPPVPKGKPKSEPKKPTPANG